MKRMADILRKVYNFFMNIEEKLIDQYENENNNTILDHDDF